MGVQGFQEYIEKHCPSAVVPVELHKLAQGQRHPHRPLHLLLDAEGCLHRLYGGLYTDWVSGGQWNHMLGYLSALAKACLQGNIQIRVCFNGALEKGRLHEWVKRQVNERQTAQQIISHVQNKGTPPPKVWFLPPVCMAHCIRLALLRVHVQVVQSMEDHHLEVMALCRENGIHGLVAYDSDYALCNVPCYFSGHTFKLSRNGKSLTSSQYLMAQVAKELNLNPNRFVIFAALLGNHILPDEDLAAFHWSLLGPEHPLASLKVRAHQLVLPPCDVVIKAVADYVRNVEDTNDLEAIARDVFKHSQSRTDDKVVRFKKAVEYYAIASSTCLSTPPVGPKQMGGPAAAPQYAPKTLDIPLARLPSAALAVEPSLALDPAQGCPPAQDTFNNIPPGGAPSRLYERCSPINPAHAQDTFLTNSSTSSSSENDDHSASTANHVNDCNAGRVNNTSCHYDNKREEPLVDQSKADLSVTSAVSPGLEEVTGQIPSLLSMPTRNHMDLTTPPLPVVAPEVLRVAEHRHRKGLMYPYIYHVLTKGEIKISVSIEDETNKDLPSAVQLFRPLRQYIYGVLFSLAEAKRRTERLAIRKRCLPDYSPVIIKEWAAYKDKSPHTPELVEALPFREWTCPSLKKLWLGKAVEDKNHRMRAFLACMRSDTPAMLNPANVPTPLLVLCCVLRFMLQWPGVRILRRNELDAFLAQGLSPKLYEPDQLQELKIDSLDLRGIQLAALFMSGVDMALFANDVCGQPIPWEQCCPWMYFDGKLLQSKLIRASREKAQLLDLCDGQADLAAKVDRMRLSILEGLTFSRPTHLLPPFPHTMPFYPHGSSFCSPPPMLPHQRRVRGVSGLQAMSSQGGKLEIAGTVVGQWAGGRRGRGRGGLPVQVVSVGGPNRGCSRGVISTPVIRTFGRGVRPYSRGWKSPMKCQQGKPTHGQDTAKERKTPRPGEEKRPPPAEGKEAEQLNGVEEASGALIQPESAFSSDSKMCPTNPLLNALHADGERHRDIAVGSSVSKQEE